MVGSSECRKSPRPRTGPSLCRAHAFQRFGTTRLRHASQIACLAFSPNSKLLAAGGGNDVVHLWNAETGAEQQQQFKEYWVAALAFSPRENVLATAGAFKKIRLWDAATGRRVLEGLATPSSFNADGNLLASGGQDGSVLLWKPDMTRPFNTLEGTSTRSPAWPLHPTG